MDITAMNKCLDAAYGTTRAAGCPSAHTLGLFFGDPRDGGVEITGGGYARITINAADWQAAVDGEKSHDWKQFPDATDAWSSEATYWALYNGTEQWDVGPLSEPLNVTEAGPGPMIQITVRFADAIDTGEE